MTGSSSRYDTDVIMCPGDDSVLCIDEQLWAYLRETKSGFEREIARIVDDVLVHFATCECDLLMQEQHEVFNDSRA